MQFGSLRLCHGLDLAQDTLGQILDGNAAAGGLGGEVLCVDLVEGGKVGDIGQEAGGLDDLVVAGTGGFQDRAHVLAALLGLGGDELAISMPGGELTVSLTASGGSVQDIYLTGPTNVVCTGDILDEDVLG